MKHHYLKSRLALVFTILLMSISSLLAQGSGSFTRTLKLSTQTLNQIFQSKEGDRFDLPLRNEKGETIQFQTSTYRHLNPGAQSGAIRLDLISANRTFKCLLSRKAVNGKIEYQIRLMENKGKLNYTLASSNNEEFLLQQTELEDIITQ
jgi:hypothetical protein